MKSELGELREAGIGAAREARPTLAALLDAVGDAHPALASTITGVIGTLFGAEVAGERELLALLGEAMTSLRALLDEDRWAADDRVARAVSRSLALLHGPRAALAAALGERTEREHTAPFLLTSARVKSTEDSPDPEIPGPALEVDVGRSGASRFYTGKSGDLGRGGLFIATDEPLAVGTELVLSVVLPDGHRVRAAGAVAWVRAPRYRPNELPAGMGVRFERLDARDLDAIRAYLEQRPPFHYGD